MREIHFNIMECCGAGQSRPCIQYQVIRNCFLCRWSI